MHRRPQASHRPGALPPRTSLLGKERSRLGKPRNSRTLRRGIVGTPPFSLRRSRNSLPGLRGVAACMLVPMEPGPTYLILRFSPAFISLPSWPLPDPQRWWRAQPVHSAWAEHRRQMNPVADSPLHSYCSLRVPTSRCFFSRHLPRAVTAFFAAVRPLHPCIRQMFGRFDLE